MVQIFFVPLFFLRSDFEDFDMLNSLGVVSYVFAQSKHIKPQDLCEVIGLFLVGTWRGHGAERPGSTDLPRPNFQKFHPVWTVELFQLRFLDKDSIWW